MFARTISALMLVGLLACGETTTSAPPPVPASASPRESTQTLGTLDGVTLSRGDLDEDALRRLIEQENEGSQRELHLLWVGFEDTVAKKLLEREAERRKLSVEALLAQEVEAKLPVPSDDEVRSLYDANADAIGVPFEQAKEYIKREMNEQGREEGRRAFVERLRQTADVRYALPVPALPRFPVEPGHGPVWGQSSAKVTLIEFSDYQCPYCGQARRVIDELKARYPNDLRVVHRDFPLSQHPQARPAAEAAYCAGEQGKFWPYYDKLFDNATALSGDDLKRYAQELTLDVGKFEECVGSERPGAAVNSHLDAGRRFGVQGTPAIYLNGIKLIGLLPLPILQALVENELRQAAR